MAQQPLPFVDIFPREQNVILAQHGIDVSRTELPADGAPVLVPDDACGLIEHLPAALPGEKTEVCIFKVKGRENLVESAELEKLAAIECAGSASAVETGEQAIHTGIIAMGNT